MKQNDPTPEEALALLNRDQLNRVTRVATKGGVLNESDRRRYRKILRRSKLPLPKVEKGQKVTRPETKFEGTFTQRQRRRRVYELRLRNYSMREMAAELNCSKNAIESDLKHIDSALQQTLEVTGIADAIMNEALADLEAVKTIASQEIGGAEGNERVGLLNTIVNATKVKIEMLQNAGTLPTAPRKLQHSTPSGAPIPLLGSVTNIHVILSEAKKDSPPVIYEMIHVSALPQED